MPVSAATEAIAKALACGRSGCGCGKRSGNGWKTHCPTHNDPDPSLNVCDTDGGRVLVHDFGGCEPEVVIEALRERGRWPTSDSKRTERRIIATYDYPDENGKLLYQVVRYDPKDFRQRRPSGDGHWIWGLTAGYYRQGADGDWRKVEKGEIGGTRFGETRRVLYRLPELLAAPPDALIFVVEGEKDADNLAALGMVATTNPGGAGKWRPEYNEVLRGRRVAILPDNDKPGRSHAQQVAAALVGIA